MTKNEKRERKLKIGYGIRELGSSIFNRKKAVYPKLMLQGNWLNDAGFFIGEEVTLLVEEGKITITALTGEDFK
jgi:hypothetical protein